MSDNQVTDRVVDRSIAEDQPASAPSGAQVEPVVVKQSFVRRYRLPIFLAVVAACLYASSILYFVYGKGQLA